MWTADQVPNGRYTPLFEYFTAENAGAFRVVADDYVSSEDGTGIVHQVHPHPQQPQQSRGIQSRARQISNTLWTLKRIRASG